MNLRAGGEGSRGGGVDTTSSVVSVRALRDGGGGGGPRRLPELIPVPCGLIVFALGAAGGGGGGARGFGWSSTGGAGSAAPCFCCIYPIMKSEFSAIWSSVIPIFCNSSINGFHSGSLGSNGSSALAGGALGGNEGGCNDGGAAGGIIDCAC